MAAESVERWVEVRAETLAVRRVDQRAGRMVGLKEVQWVE
jgi:hypothetical protein